MKSWSSTSRIRLIMTKCYNNISREGDSPCGGFFNMADRKRNAFEARPNNNENSDQRRVSEQITESRDTSEPTSPGTATRPVPHVVEAHRLMEVDQTDRQTSDQNVQGEGGSQLVPGSSLNVVGSQGPVQLGTGSTVINNPTYNDNSQHHHHHHHHYHPSPYHPAYHNDYLRWIEQKATALGSGPSHPQLPSCPVPQSRDNDQLEGQTSRSEDITDRNTSAQSQTERKTFHHADHKSSYHVPCHCKDCQHYHNNDHKPVAESRTPHQESESRHLGCPHHPLPQILPSTEEGKPTNRSGNVTDTRRRENAISTDREKETGTRPQSLSVTRDTVSIVDSEGQVLEPGDALWTEGLRYHTRAIYIGHQMLVWCDWRTGSKMAKKEQLCMTAPFGKCTVYSDGRLPVYPPGERVDRATTRIGHIYDGDSRLAGADFTTWVYTGKGMFEAVDEGFELSY